MFWNGKVNIVHLFPLLFTLAVVSQCCLVEFCNSHEEAGVRELELQEQDRALQAQVAGLQSASAEDIEEIETEGLTLRNTGYAEISWEIRRPLGATRL